jgi:hypothetical protein
VAIVTRISSVNRNPPQAFKAFLREKHLHVAQQLPLIGRREPVKKRKICAR